MADEATLHENGSRARNSLALPDDSDAIGHVEPIIGRIAQRDVQAYFGFPLIKKGETVTPSVAERAQSLGRLFELIAATGDQ